MSKRIPVKIAGMVVGSALIDLEGNIQITMDGPSIMGKAILEELEIGMVSSLSLSTVPPQPMIVESPFRLAGSNRSFQIGDGNRQINII